MAGRRLIGSDIVIVLAIIMHVFDAAAMAFTRSADGSISMAAILEVLRWPWVASLALAVSAIMAAFGHWLPNISAGKRMGLLIGQQTLLILPALGAVYAILHGSYADGVPRSWEFISVDQFVTIGAPLIYTAAILARVKS